MQGNFIYFCLWGSIQAKSPSSGVKGSTHLWIVLPWDLLVQRSSYSKVVPESHHWCNCVSRFSTLWRCNSREMLANLKLVHSEANLTLSNVSYSLVSAFKIPVFRDLFTKSQVSSTQIQTDNTQIVKKHLCAPMHVQYMIAKSVCMCVETTCLWSVHVCEGNRGTELAVHQFHYHMYEMPSLVIWTDIWTFLFACPFTKPDLTHPVALKYRALKANWQSGLALCQLYQLFPMP